MTALLHTQARSTGQTGRKALLAAIIGIGVSLVAFSGWALYADIAAIHPGHESEQVFPYAWYTMFGSFVGGAVAGSLALRRWSYWYDQVVGLATVQDHDYETGHYGSYFYLVIAGRNRANQIIRERYGVQPRLYYGLEVGGEIIARPRAR